MSEITKEEIAIMIEVQSKTVINLEKIATSLKDIVAEQKALTESQQKLKEELISGIVKTKIDKLHTDILYNKTLLTTASVVVIISVVVLKVLGF